MLKSILISKVSTFQGENQLLENISKFNFIFGCNGSGKTTISRIIANSSKYALCKLTWQQNKALETFVYNRDFVEENFKPSSKLKGVFTLGEGGNIKDEIEKSKTTLNNIENKLGSLNLQLQGEDKYGNKIGKNVELLNLEDDFKKKCWKQKLKYDDKLKGCLKGYRNDVENFKNKILQEFSNNSSEFVTLENIEKKVATIFDQNLSQEEELPLINFRKLQHHELNSILSKKIVGTDDVDISAMIKKLNNSDWVKDGLDFYKNNSSATCPFCQQDTDESFSKSLVKYFSEAYEEDNKLIQELIDIYKLDSDILEDQILSVINKDSKSIDLEQKELSIKKVELMSIIERNFQKLSDKQKEPSRSISLESTKDVVLSIDVILSKANSNIREHNTLAKNIKKERETTTGQVWKFLLEEMKLDLNEYSKNKQDIQANINDIKSFIINEELNKRTELKKIADLEKKATSVVKVLNDINDLLYNIEFRSFSLSMAEDNISYKIIRADGTNVEDTLSEGEKSFITFLYFYYLVGGSNSSDGVTKERIVVFDDPVSSLDSNILFIVSSLIESLFKEIQEGKGSVKQIFILTHNTYFHKEVSFHLKKSTKDFGYPPATFWIVRKNNLISQIESHNNNNPIKTSYELLWSEIRIDNPTGAQVATANTLRRILEHYFKILGGVDFNEICEEFQDKDKFICKSLFSWINAGSHEVFDDVHMSDVNIPISTYLRVFKEIFIKHNHESHYNMMMGISKKI